MRSWDVTIYIYIFIVIYIYIYSYILRRLYIYIYILYRHNFACPLGRFARDGIQVSTDRYKDPFLSSVCVCVCVPCRRFVCNFPVLFHLQDLDTQEGHELPPVPGEDRKCLKYLTSRQKLQPIYANPSHLLKTDPCSCSLHFSGFGRTRST